MQLSTKRRILRDSHADGDAMSGQEKLF